MQLDPLANDVVYTVSVILILRILWNFGIRLKNDRLNQLLHLSHFLSVVSTNQPIQLKHLNTTNLLIMKNGTETNQLIVAWPIC